MNGVQGLNVVIPKLIVGCSGFSVDGEKGMFCLHMSGCLFQQM